MPKPTSQPHPLPPPLRAGVAKSDITIDAKEAPVSDPLYAKALVLDDGRTTLAIVTMDVVAIGGICDVGDDFLPNLRARIETELNIPGRNVLVNASHTHPPGRIVCEESELLARTFDAVRRALETLTEVTAGSGTAQENRISMNRNLRLKNGKHWTIRHANPCPPDEAVEAVGPTDPEIGILRIDRIGGEPLAVVYNYACHLLFGDTRGSVTANIPGIASRIIEESWGRDTMAFFLQGAAGDVIDVTFKDFNHPRDIEPLGVMLGLDVLKALRGIATKEAALGIVSESVKLPRRTDIPGRIESLREEQKELLESLRFTSLNFKSFLPLYLRHALSPECPADYSHAYLQADKIGNPKPAAMDGFNRQHIEKYLQNIHAMEKLARIEDELATFERHFAINEESGRETIDAEIQGIRIGDCVFIAAPVEVLTEVGLNIKETSPHEHTFIAAFSNGYMHYGPPACDYDKGGYEVTECFLAPQWQTVFEEKAQAILQAI